MTRHTITTSGNARAHIVHEGYRNTPRIPGPLAKDAAPLRLWLLALPVLIALGTVVLGAGR